MDEESELPHQAPRHVKGMKLRQNVQEPKSRSNLDHKIPPGSHERGKMRDQLAGLQQRRPQLNEESELPPQGTKICQGYEATAKCSRTKEERGYIKAERTKQMILSTGNLVRWRRPGHKPRCPKVAANKTQAPLREKAQLGKHNVNIKGYSKMALGNRNKHLEEVL